MENPKLNSALNNIKSGYLQVGSKTPITGLPMWATYEVLCGGFATGNLLASGPLLPFERNLLNALNVDPLSNPREAINRYYLGLGISELEEMLQYSKFNVTVVEESALLFYVWLMKNGRKSEADAILKEIEPHFSMFRFYPQPTEEPVGAPTITLRPLTCIQRLLEKSKFVIERECDKKEILELWMSTLANGDQPTMIHGVTKGAWPCQNYPKDWDEKALLLLQKCEYSYHLPLKFRFLLDCVRVAVGNRLNLTGSQVNSIRNILALVNSKAKGLPGSEAYERYMNYIVDPITKRIKFFEALINGKLGMENDIRSLGSKALNKRYSHVHEFKSVEIDNIDIDLVHSFEQLEDVFAFSVCSDIANSFTDPTLRYLFRLSLLAFTKKRSLVLNNLQSQAKWTDVMWFSFFKHSILEGESTGEINKTMAQAVRKLGHTLISNRLVGILKLSPKFRNVPLVKHIATDLYTGELNPVYEKSFKFTADYLKGTAYYNYYRLNYGTDFKERRLLFEPENPADEIRQISVLSSTNLAAICSTLRLEEYLTKKDVINLISKCGYSSNWIGFYFFCSFGQKHFNLQCEELESEHAKLMREAVKGTNTELIQSRESSFGFVKGFAKRFLDISQKLPKLTLLPADILLVACEPGSYKALIRHLKRRHYPIYLRNIHQFIEMEDFNKIMEKSFLNKLYSHDHIEHVLYILELYPDLLFSSYHEALYYVCSTVHRYDRFSSSHLKSSLLNLLKASDKSIIFNLLRTAWSTQNVSLARDLFGLGTLCDADIECFFQKEFHNLRLSAGTFPIPFKTEVVKMFLYNDIIKQRILSEASNVDLMKVFLSCFPDYDHKPSGFNALKVFCGHKGNEKLIRNFLSRKEISISEDYAALIEIILLGLPCYLHFIYKLVPYLKEKDLDLIKRMLQVCIDERITLALLSLKFLPGEFILDTLKLVQTPSLSMIKVLLSDSRIPRVYLFNGFVQRSPSPRVESLLRNSDMSNEEFECLIDFSTDAQAFKFFKAFQKPLLGSSISQDRSLRLLIKYATDNELIAELQNKATVELSERHLLLGMERSLQVFKEILKHANVKISSNVFQKAISLKKYKHLELLGNVSVNVDVLLDLNLSGVELEVYNSMQHNMTALLLLKLVGNRDSHASRSLYKSLWKSGKISSDFSDWIGLEHAISMGDNALFQGLWKDIVNPDIVKLTRLANHHQRVEIIRTLVSSPHFVLEDNLKSFSSSYANLKKECSILSIVFTAHPEASNLLLDKLKELPVNCVTFPLFKIAVKSLRTDLLNALLESVVGRYGTTYLGLKMLYLEYDRVYPFVKARYFIRNNDLTRVKEIVAQIPDFAVTEFDFFCSVIAGDLKMVKFLVKYLKGIPSMPLYCSSSKMTQFLKSEGLIDSTLEDAQEAVYDTGIRRRIVR